MKNAKPSPRVLLTKPQGFCRDWFSRETTRQIWCHPLFEPISQGLDERIPNSRLQWDLEKKMIIGRLL
jgi:hypothetical protein